ncbi:MAG: sugar ABC transporter ATP-binding protein, partial [Anaerolineae bacterium]|nr:sugar ABC transporter ATP-binding protein [Anaerolineae bacterium]
REGETHALVGENGAGKSTLMRILAGIYTRDQGEYLLNGQPVHLTSPHDALARGIGRIHQELSVMPELSVAENVFLGRQLTTRFGMIDWRRMDQIAHEELTKLGFGSIDVRRPLGKYALGIQQVVEVLRVILSGARVLIMDEPTSALSTAEIERLIELIDTLRQSNRSIIYISHFLEEVMRVADRITVLRDGRKVATLNRSETNVHQLVTLILGREINATLPPAIGHAAEEHTLLDVTDLNSDVFKNISFSVHEGEVLGIYGAVGSGHFDLARALFGIYRYDTGTIKVDGRVFPQNFSARYAIQHGLAYATESRRKSLLMEQPNFRNVTLPHLFRIGRLIPRQKQELEISRPVLDVVGTHPADPEYITGRLSGGNQQNVAIARWLTFPPKVFIMSEPTRGMDVGAKSEVLGVLRKFRNEGYGVVVISTEPETVLAVSDRVIVMSHGAIVAHMENKDLNKDVLLRLL